MKTMEAVRSPITKSIIVPKNMQVIQILGHHISMTTTKTVRFSDLRLDFQLQIFTELKNIQVIQIH